MPPDSTTVEVNERTLKITASITVRKPGKEPYSFSEFQVHFGKEYPVSTDITEAKQEVAREAAASLLELGKQYKSQYESLTAPTHA